MPRGVRLLLPRLTALLAALLAVLVVLPLLRLVQVVWQEGNGDLAIERLHGARDFCEVRIERREEDRLRGT